MTGSAGGARTGVGFQLIEWPHFTALHNKINRKVKVRLQTAAPGWCRAVAAFLFVAATSTALQAQDVSGIDQGSEYAQGVQAFALGDFEKAADLWLADAYLGSAESQFNIGVLYTEGKGLPRDRGEALSWFEKAAQQGHVEAQYNLGHLLLEDQGDLDSIRRGIDWWRRSAEGGFAVAQYNYGRALFHGIGVERNPGAAKTWFERARDNGNSHAGEFLLAHGDELDSISEVSKDPVRTTREPETPPVPGATDDTAIPVAGAPGRFEYVAVQGEPAFMYARFNTLSPIISQVGSRVLLRVITRKSNWILAAAPGGLPGWVMKSHVSIDKDLVEIRSERALVHADPTEDSDSNDIGELERGARVLLLEADADWVRVQLPEVIPGWIEDRWVRDVQGDANEITAIWQRQQIERKVSALSSRQTRLAALTPDEAPARESGVNSGVTAGEEPRDRAEVASDRPPDPQPKRLSTVATLATADIISTVDTSNIVVASARTTDRQRGKPDLTEPVSAVDPVAGTPPAPRDPEPETLDPPAVPQASGGSVAGASAAASAGDESEAAGAKDPAIRVTEASPERVGGSGAETPRRPEVSLVVKHPPEDGTVADSPSGPDPVAMAPLPARVSDPDSGRLTPEAGVPAPAEDTADTAVAGVPASAGGASGPADAADAGEEILASGTVGQRPSPYFELNRDGAEVFSAPAPRGRVVARLPAGTLVDVVGYQGDHAEISIPGGLPVWVPEAETGRQGDDVVIRGRRVRGWPDPGEDRGDHAMGLLPEGSILRVLARRDGWVRVMAPEWVTAWVNADALVRPASSTIIHTVWQQQAAVLAAGYESVPVPDPEPGAEPVRASSPRVGGLAGTGVDNDNAWLFENASGNYTLQLFSMQSLESARSLHESLDGQGQFFSTTIRGNRWYFVLLGKFASQAAARSVAQTLPRWASGAEIRTLARLQTNRCGKRDQLAEDESVGLERLCP